MWRRGDKHRRERGVGCQIEGRTCGTDEIGREQLWRYMHFCLEQYVLHEEFANDVPIYACHE